MGFKVMLLDVHFHTWRRPRLAWCRFAAGSWTSVTCLNLGAKLAPVRLRVWIRLCRGQMNSVSSQQTLSLAVCVLDWVGAGRGPPIVAAVLAVTGGESTRTLQYNRSGNKSWALFWLFSCFSVNDQLFLTLVRFERVYRISIHPDYFIR